MGGMLRASVAGGREDGAGGEGESLAFLETGDLKKLSRVRLDIVFFIWGYSRTIVVECLLDCCSCEFVDGLEFREDALIVDVIDHENT